MRSFVDEMQRLEQMPKILNVWLAHGFPLGDVPTTGVKVVVVIDDDRVRGDEIMETVMGFVATSQDDYQLNVTSIIKHAARNCARQEIISQRLCCGKEISFG